MAITPSLTALRCFEASAQHGSFTKAGLEVHLTQGAVSHQILGLETLLGVALFVRKKSGLELTSAGHAYRTEVSSALRHLERATQNLMTNKGHGGALNLCVASSFATYWLIPRLAQFVAAHPEVTLNLSTHIGPVDFSLSNHDAAIEFCAGDESGLSAEFVHPLELRPYCSPRLLQGKTRPKRRPRSPSDTAVVAVLANHPLIRHSTVPDAWPDWLRQAALHHKLPTFHLSAGPRYDLLSMALNGAIAGLGVALLPDYIAAGASASGQLVPLSDCRWTAPKAYYLRFPQWKTELTALRRFSLWLQTIGQSSTS